jgi:hypothetical protein
MSKLKMLAAATLATAGIGLAAAPVASAKPMTCGQAMSMARLYIATGDVYYSLGQYSLASAYYGRAQGVVEAAC